MYTNPQTAIVFTAILLITIVAVAIASNDTAVFSKFGRDAPWGIYTQNEQDAILYMNTLQPGRPLDGPEASSGGYPHYHYGDNERKFYRYKHFHAWYGEINS